MKLFFKKSLYGLFFSSLFILSNNSNTLASEVSIQHKHYKNHINHNHAHHHKHHIKHNHMYHHKHKNDNKHDNDFDKYKQYNKYDKFFISFNGGIGFSLDNSKDFKIETINRENFDAIVAIDFPSMSFSSKMKNSFNGGIGFGRWIKNNASIALDIDYLSSSREQNNAYEFSKLNNKMLSVVASSSIHYDCKKISPYFNIGLGIGYSMIDGFITSPDLAALAITTAAKIGASIEVSNLNKILGVAKIGAGLSKEYKNSMIGVGYQFIKTTKFDKVNTDAVIKLAGNKPLIDNNNFKFGDLSYPDHLIKLFIKSNI
jgi:hypothetical protein